jgi:hypothetical protein
MSDLRLLVTTLTFPAFEGPEPWQLSRQDVASTPAVLATSSSYGRPRVDILLRLDASPPSP